MSDGIVFIDGEYMRPQDATMSIFDTGFVWGDGVYDVTSTWNGWFFMLDEHLERFQRSCEGFRIENPWSFEEMRRICAECVDRAGLSNAYVKMQITRGVPPPGVRDPRGLKPSVVVYAVPYVWIWGEDRCRNGASLFVSGVERVSSRAIDQRFKNYNRADLVQARLEAYDNGCDDAVLTGPDGCLTEGRASTSSSSATAPSQAPTTTCSKGSRAAQCASCANARGSRSSCARSAQRRWLRRARCSRAPPRAG